MKTLTEDDIRAIALDTLREIAPGEDLDGVEPDVPFHDQFDFDSMDFLNFAIALHKKLEIEIPEKDYLLLGTLNGCVGYLSDRLSAQSQRD
jgi:acyl carrier protein